MDLAKKKMYSISLECNGWNWGKWKLNSKTWEIVKKNYIKTVPDTKWDKYAYIVKLKNPNYGMGEWQCPLKMRIPQNSCKHSFRYDKKFYSPKEEMADAYALFATNREFFKKCAKRNKNIQPKYYFIEKCFEDNSKGEIIFKR